MLQLAQNVGRPPHIWKKINTLLFSAKKQLKTASNFCDFQTKLPKVINRLIGENSSNLVTLVFFLLRPKLCRPRVTR
jgi:hypothetical protein